VDRLDAMRAFAAVAEAQGFAAAARRLALSPPAVTRAIASLEERLGARLLHRTTRVVRLTEAGVRFLGECKRILGEIDEAEAAVAGIQTELRGELAVTASAAFGRAYVAPLVLEFLGLHPRLSARTLYVDRVVELTEEGFDVAVRIAHLPDSSLTAIPAGSVRRVVCASPAYLSAHGKPRSPEDLARFDTIGFSPGLTAEAWLFGSGSGKLRSVTPSPRLLVNTAEVAIAAAVEGWGLTRVLSYMVEPEVRAGRLKIVLAGFEPAPIPISLVYREGRKAATKVRAFVDFTAARLRPRARLPG
jgi:DNA-binding transcriptional LysR family regulator